MTTCCYDDTSNHSADVLLVFCGRVEPVRICGYHELSRGVPQSEAVTPARHTHSES